MKNKLWLVFILITIVTWGVWGAFSDTQMDRDNIPETVVYILWALTMIPCAIVALCVNKGKFMHDWKSAVLGCTVGLLGAGGQLVLFKALAIGPAYIIFPFISMSPVIVITLASIFLKEMRTNGRLPVSLWLWQLSYYFLSSPVEPIVLSADGCGSYWLYWFSLLGVSKDSS